MNLITKVSFLFVCLTVLVGQVLATDLRFTNITQAAGINHLHVGASGAEEVGWMSGGAVAEDFDGDGYLDLYVLQGLNGTNLLYMNDGLGGFVEQAAARGVAYTQSCMGAAAGDVDSDGDRDLCFTTSDGEVILYFNSGTGVFNQCTRVDLEQEHLMSPSLGDVDNDGQLEIMVGSWSHEDQNLFILRLIHGALVPYEFRTVARDEKFVFTPRFADLNNDGLVDLAITADFGQSQLYINRGGGFFDLATTGNGVASDENGMGSAIGDVDGDGDLDWFVSSIRETNGLPEGNWGTTGNRLYRNQGTNYFTDATTLSGVRDGNWGWGSAFGDLDNDGDLDLYHVNGWPEDGEESVPPKYNNQPARLFENVGGGVFTNVAEEAGADDKGQGRGLILFDTDEDGDLDAYIANNKVLVQSGPNYTHFPGPPVLFRNDSLVTNQWLKILLEGNGAYHADGMGARVEVLAGDLYMMRELNASSGYLAQGPGRIAHFGLGTNPLVREVQITWAGGDRVVVSNLLANNVTTLPSPLSVVEPRVLLEGDAITVNASGVGVPFQWTIEGVVFTQESVVVVCTNPGTKVVQLDLFQTNGMTLKRTETFPVRVIPFVEVSNHAPVFSNDVTLGLLPVDEDDVHNQGDTVTGLLARAGHPLGDQDGDALGLAVQSVVQSNGTWQSSLDGGVSWSNFPPVSPFAAFLLADNHRIRFVPAADFHGSNQFGLVVSGWDQFMGMPGHRVNLSARGVTNAFSLETADIQVRVAPLNDPPVLTAPGLALGQEDVLLPVMPIVVSDPDIQETPSAKFQVGLNVTNGMLFLGSESGLTYLAGSNGAQALVFEGEPADVQSALTGLMYLGPLHISGQDSLTITCSDLGHTGGGSLVTNLVVSLDLVPVNDPPFVSNPLSPVVAVEDQPDLLVNVSNLFDDVDRVTDGDTLQLAITQNDTPALLQATLEGANVRLVFQPDQHGAASITLRAEDLAFAGTNHVLSVTVTPSNDPPFVAQNLPSIFSVEDGVDQLVDLSGVFDDPDLVTSGDALTLSVASNPQPSWVTAVVSGSMVNLSFSPDQHGSFDLVVGATDLAGETVEGLLSISISASNDPPLVSTPLNNITVPGGTLQSVVSLAGTFDDVDIVTAGDSLALSIASNSNPSLVSASLFGTTLTLNYVPSQVGLSDLTLRATDSFGLTTVETFRVTVSIENQAPVLNTNLFQALDPVIKDDPDPAGAALTTWIVEDLITDFNVGDPEGIAVIGSDIEQGAWEYSLNTGLAWTSLGSPSVVSAVLLPATTQTWIRFIPVPGFVGTLTTGITFRAWDQSAGQAGERDVDTSLSGGTSAFSMATAALEVSVVDHPPTRNDFDGDGQSDIGVVDVSAWNWYINRSTVGFTLQQFGFGSSLLVPADYDGDRSTDLAIYYPPTGQWFIQNSSTLVVRVVGWGFNKTIPVPADYDGDLVDDVAVFDAATGNWYILQSNTGALRLAQWGYNKTIPVPADYDGDRIADIAVYEPHTGNWYILESATSSLRQLNWGFSGVVPVPADYDGDGKADIAVYSAATGDWFILESKTLLLRQRQWGYAATKPVSGDFDGDGLADIVVYAVNSGLWHLSLSGGGGFTTKFGFPGVLAIGSRP